ncbi:MAG: hypothetical protein ACYTXI_32285 [Nostoc sp.]
MSKHLNLWLELNQQQQATLTTIDRADQSVEAAQKKVWLLGSTRERVAVWRLVSFFKACA